MSCRIYNLVETCTPGKVRAGGRGEGNRIKIIFSYNVQCDSRQLA